MSIPEIAFTETIEGVRADQLAGFFLDWSQRPSAELHLSVLCGSDRVVIARDTQTGSVVGFVTALTDGLMAAYITLLEVRPGYQRRGIGTQLVQRMLESLKPLYMIDALCDEEVLPLLQEVRRYADGGRGMAGRHGAGGHGRIGRACLAPLGRSEVHSLVVSRSGRDSGLSYA